HPENQRKTLCSYDNAVLYGDYVVKTIFDQFKDKEAIVFFFPDHSIDVYESDPTYIGHARNTNTISFEVSSNIPFIVYPTESFKNHFPDMVEKLENAVDKKFNTEDIIYTFMDLANVKFADNDDVKKYSLLSKPE
ncbi:MAG: sulfatase-like hydrolase/transferase, partial [Bacteroidales bacterium]|nr:sulfatase-like hydrolase/transferase [Bacteroidales bacterium]